MKIIFHQINADSFALTDDFVFSILYFRHILPKDYFRDYGGESFSDELAFHELNLHKCYEESEDGTIFSLEGDDFEDIHSDIVLAEAAINHIMGYRNYPNYYVHDDRVEFPALHEIGETIDELLLIMHANMLKYY